MRTFRHTARLALVALPLLAVGACQPDETEVESGEVEPTEVSVAVQIDTTAAAIQSHLQQENYQESWAMWPDREAFYPGTEPHGMLLTTYLNDAAQRGLTQMRGDTIDDMPFGAVVVKENYMPDSTLAAVTVMYKQEGYDPENHDWFWVKRLADGTVEASGRVESCITCHAQAADDWDYLRTAQSQFGG